MEAAADGDSVSEIDEGCRCEEPCEGLLSAEDDLYGKVGIESGADQESQIGQGGRVDEVSFIDEDHGGEVGFPGGFADLQEESVLSGPGSFPEGRDNEAQEPAWGDSRKMEINGTKAVSGELVDEGPQECGFAEPGLADDEGQGSLEGKVLEPGQKLGESGVLDNPLHGRIFQEGMLGHFEMVEEHGR